MTRRILTLTALVASLGLALAGCAGNVPTGGEQPLGTNPPAEAAPLVEGGDRVDDVTVEGDLGRQPSITVPNPVTDEGAKEIQRRVVTPGTGEMITDQDTVLVMWGSFDASGNLAAQYSLFGPATQLTNPQIPPFAHELFTGVPAGSRILASVPMNQLQSNATGAPMFIVADIVTVKPGQSANGTPTGETFEYADVSADEGAPTVTVHTDMEPPTEQQTTVILQGDGDTVQDGDTVIVQYSGYLLKDGTQFDSSWNTGLPPAFITDGVVPGFKNALVGQQVGSRVATVFPPELGFGDQDYPPIPGGSTLVFIADIIGIV